MDAQYTIKELSEKSGIEVRTIRWYIAEGLVRGPEAMGRNAYYTEHHLKRLMTIRTLKEIYRLPLSEIRRVCLLAGDEDIEIAIAGAPWMSESVASYMSPPAAYGPRASEPEPTRDGDRPEAAVESSPPVVRESRSYLDRARSIRQRVSPNALMAMESLVLQPPAPVHGNKSLDDLVASLRTLLGERRVSRTAKAETLTAIDITPDMMLQIRGRYSREELSRFEALADHLRELLVGGVPAEKKESE